MGVVYLDISKAFDRIWQPGLMHKPESVGIRGNALRWFHSFLFDQQQCTAVGRFSSSVQKLHAGVPQVAILSPLLFSLYKNDLVKSASGNRNLLLMTRLLMSLQSPSFALQEKM